MCLMGALFGGKDACHEARLYHEDRPGAHSRQLGYA